MSLLLRRRMLLNAIQEPVNIFDKSQSIVEGIRNGTVINRYAEVIFTSAYTATMFKPNTIYEMSYDVEYVWNTDTPKNNVVGFDLIDNSGANQQINLYTLSYYPMGTKRSDKYTFVTPANINGGTWRMYVYVGRYKDSTGATVNGEMIFRNIKIVEA